MDNQIILRELTDYIKDICKISIEDIIIFLLGDDLGFSLSRQALHQLYRGTHKLSPDNLCLLANSPNCRFNNLSKLTRFFKDNRTMSQLDAAIRPLFLKFFPDDFPGIDFFSMVQSLVFLYFFGTDDIDDMFYPYTIHTCKNYIPWEEKEIDLDQLLKKDHMIFVTGFPASGKSQLLKHYIKTKCKWNDIFWLSDNSKLPLEDRLLDIKFLCKSHKTNTNFENILQRLSNKNSSSLLVIDIPSIKDKDFDFIHQHFDNLTLDIIIKTRTLENLPADKSVNLNNRPVSNLKQIFKSNASEDFFTNENSDDEFNRLCSIISYNPFIITLLAKSQNKKRFKIDKLLSTQSWYMDEKNLPTNHRHMAQPPALLVVWTSPSRASLHFRLKAV